MLKCQLRRDKFWKRDFGFDKKDYSGYGYDKRDFGFDKKDYSGYGYDKRRGILDLTRKVWVVITRKTTYALY